jgi:hypothetical protein
MKSTDAVLIGEVMSDRPTSAAPSLEIQIWARPSEISVCLKHQRRADGEWDRCHTWVGLAEARDMLAVLKVGTHPQRSGLPNHYANRTWCYLEWEGAPNGLTLCRYESDYFRIAWRVSGAAGDSWPDNAGRIASTIAAHRCIFASDPSWVSACFLRGGNLNQPGRTLASASFVGFVDILGKAIEYADGRIAESTAAAKVPNVAKVTWESLILPHDTKRLLISTSKVWTHHDALVAQGVDVKRYVLLHGPPGTGKTEIARVLATESGLAVLLKSSADMVGAYTGQTLLAVKRVFEEARAMSPCILFLDELDVLTSSRQHTQGEAVGQLLQELDGIVKHPGFVAVVAATNLPDKIDPAIRSRFSPIIPVELPDEEARAGIVESLLTGKPFSGDVRAVAITIAKRTEGKSGRDLKGIVGDAERRAVERAIDKGNVADVKIDVEDFGQIGFGLRAVG